MASGNDVIDNFAGDQYRFLSNFSKWSVTYDGIKYPTSEHAFQAMKTRDGRIRTIFAQLDTPSDAKLLGGNIKLRDNWDVVKESFMRNIVTLKFRQHERLKEKLLATGDALLIEGNTWGDKVWGVCNGTGDNKLGSILMSVRDLIREEGEDK